MIVHVRMDKMDTAKRIVGQLLDVINGDTELGKNGAELAMFDAEIIDDRVEEMQETLDTYLMIDEVELVKSVRKILESYDTITNDDELAYDILFDIMDALTDNNAKCRGVNYETSRRTTS